ncbi:MAG: hypothetical protein LBJ62_06510 [Bifidobacteriaceae bacterium]|nr:hypothetical protein [Bifidobacteriaceae bacterium]
MKVEADRWLEIDLYWFDRDDIAGAVRRFWERCEPLLVGVTGWRGVIVNAGWLVDHVLGWSGDLDQPVPFPPGLTADKFFPDRAALRGTTAQRQAGWRSRFADRGRRADLGYQPWTYRDLGRLADLLRGIGQTEFGISGLKVGVFVLGWDSIYGREPSAWSARHPEAFFAGPWHDQLFNVAARLQADDAVYAAFPDGIVPGTPVTRFFGRQWGELRRQVHLDAIVLRDSMIGQGIYERVGPFGETASPDPEVVQEWSDATGELIRQTKLAAPEALVIGYSNAASAVADWRVNCVDLESIAHQGFLDAWIDQTWAGAWNEVGQRENTFWNEPLLGWTNQLGYVLGHAVALAGTPVRHYTLAETFDAWESWDIIHTAPARLRWGIWAYLHAFLLTPDGLKAPAGTYVSWMNQGSRLLEAEDVEFLADTINQATVDARRTVVVHGPVAVYCREALAWASRHQPDQTMKEWIDEQIGWLAKYSLPVTAITRAEYLASIQADHLIVQTPVHLPDDQRDLLLRRIRRGDPTMVVGSPGPGVDRLIAEAAGLISADSAVGPVKTVAHLGPSLRPGVDAGLEGGDLPEEFSIVQPWTANQAVGGAEVIYQVDGSPALVRRDLISSWDPPEVIHRSVSDLVGGHGGPRGDLSMTQRLGSPYGVLLAAAEIMRALKLTGRIAAEPLEATSPVAMSAWTRDDAVTMVLLGELEEGFRESTEGDWRLTVTGLGEPLEVCLSYGQSQLYAVGSDTSGSVRIVPKWAEGSDVDS